MLNRQRLDTVINNMKACGLRQIIVSDDNAMFYLMGRRIGPMERCCALLIKDSGEIHAFMNRLFCFQPIEGVALHEYRDGQDVYAMIADELAPGTVGLDKEWPCRHALPVLQKRSDITPVLGSDPIDMARARKGSDEIELLRAAGRVNDETIAFAIEHISPDRTEAELAQLIFEFFTEHGGEPGSQIVCYGANAAEPHHNADATRLRPGDAVLIDEFCPIGGYWCDMTRTVFYQTVSEHHRRVYEIVKAAQQAGIDFVKPGVRMSQIDGAVRQVITDAGYGDAFITRTGHGIGAMVHEPPDVSSSCDMIAQPGMVFSIEPGIYLPGDVGVRIEDLVLVTETGCEVLTRYPKDLQIVG